MKFEIIDEVVGIEIIAIGSSIRDLSYLQKIYGRGRWRKLKVLPTSNCLTAIFAMLNFTGRKHMGSVEKTLRSKNIWIDL